MHKYYLTKTECGFIKGADRIINEFGCFPSMENGQIRNIRIMPSQRLEHRYDISIEFDITDWKKYSQLPNGDHIPETDSSTILLRFDGAHEFSITPRCIDMIDSCGGIKFTNDWNQKNWSQDGWPNSIPEIPRPFRAFYIRRGDEFSIRFWDDECIASAEYY